MKCLNCGSEMPDGAMFCDNCGQKLDAIMPSNEVHYCPNCGEMIEVGTEFCGNCGHHIFAVEKTEPQRVFCGNCGAEIDGETEFCGYCGAAVKVSNQTNNYTTKANNYTRKKNSLFGVVIVLVSVFAILLCLFSVYLFRVRSENKIYTTENDVLRSSQIDDNSETDDRKDDSKTYKNSGDQNGIATTKPKVQPPEFTYATASSTRGTDTEGGQYSAEAVLSSDKMTKWVPAKESNGGIKEWIQINSSEVQYVKGILILNGYHKSDEIWHNNNRVRSCTISFSNGQSKNVLLDDTMDLIKIDLSTPVNTKYIRLTINSIYSGTKWNDTAITYLGAY